MTSPDSTPEPRDPESEARPASPESADAHPGQAPSPYPDEATGGDEAMLSPYPDEAPSAGNGPSPHAGGPQRQPAPPVGSPVTVPVGAGTVVYRDDTAPPVGYDVPADIPPWYEDDFYDDRDWEPLPRRSSTWMRVGAFAGVLLIVGLFAYRYVDSWVQSQLDPPGEPGEEVVIEVPQGATTNDIVRILADEGVVSNSIVFRYWLRWGDDEDPDEFQAGRYTFRLNSAVEDARAVLAAGPVTPEDTRIPVLIPEGLTLEEIKATLLRELEDFDAAELDEAVGNVTPPNVFGTAVLFNSEGWLFPSTYDVDQLSRTDELSLLNRMVAQFDLVAIETGLRNAEDLVGVTPYEALTIASLIEEEAQAPGDRAKIARVIYNRLEQGMPLQIDATVVYANGGDRDISQADLDRESEYNTYLIPGLPPSPIAAPGKAAIEAALAPAEGDWLFYVLTDVDEQGRGVHTFSTTLDEHNAAVQICVEKNLGCG